MEQFNYKKLFLTKYMMIKKQAINTQFFLNKKKNNYKNNFYSELNFKVLSSFLYSGKIIVRNFKIKRSMTNWSFASTFPNGGFFKRKIKAKKIIKVNIFPLFSKINNFFLEKNLFYSVKIPSVYSLYNNLPRNILIFLINNQVDYFLEKEKTFFRNSHLYNSMVLLKKKVPVKTALLNFFYFIKTFEMIYACLILKKNLKGKNLIFNKIIFFKKYSILLLLFL